MAGTIVKVEAILNGQTYQLTKGTGDTWSVSATAPTSTSGSNNNGQGPGVGAEAQGKGYYPVIIKATDDFGNVTTVDVTDTTWGNALKLKVLEKTAPVATLTSPSSSAYIKSAKPTITFTVTDSGSGVNPNECYVVIDSGMPVKATASVSGTTATCTFTPTANLSDGEHTVKAYGSDFDGNKSNEASATFTIDTTPPTLNVTSPAEEITKTNLLTITVAGTTNDETSSPVTIKITGGAEDYENVTVTGGAFSQVVKLTNNATNTLVITATDSAGQVTTVTRTVVVNTTVPVITDIAITPNPSDVGGSLSISLTARSV
jgi:hypothetical protein